MAKIITMPSTPNFIRSNFRLFRAIGETVSPFTGQVKTQEFDAVYWMADVTLPPMKRSVAVNWQAFLMELKGTANHFKFADPDALTNTGTYSTQWLSADARLGSATSITLSFSGNTITTGGATPFSGANVGDFIHVTGATNDTNNGTHKITAATSGSEVDVDTDLVTEASTSGCKVKQNVKGATGLSLLAQTNAATGTIKKGDYLGILSSNSADATPAQYVMVTEDATVTTDAAKDFYSVKTEPKLRSDLTDGYIVKFNNPQGLFRLASNEVEWSADRASTYGISFSCIEVV